MQIFWLLESSSQPHLPNMHLMLPTLVLLSSSGLSVAWGAPGFEESGPLLRRQESDGDCSSSDTCSQCYGPGNVICSYISCFNPSQHEQCCGDGSEFSPFQAAPNLGTTKKVIKNPSSDMLTRYSRQATVSRPTIVAVVLW